MERFYKPRFFCSLHGKLLILFVLKEMKLITTCGICITAWFFFVKKTTAFSQLKFNSDLKFNVVATNSNFSSLSKGIIGLE